MDRLENRLREDAARISAAVPAGFSSRIRHALAREDKLTHAVAPRLRPGPRLLAGAALGFVAAVAGILWIEQSVPSQPAAQAGSAPASLAAYQDTVARLSGVVDRRLPNERELEREMDLLTADLRHLRSRVNSELDPLL